MFDDDIQSRGAAAGQLVQAAPDVFTTTPAHAFSCRLFCQPLESQPAAGSVRDIILMPTSLSASTTDGTATEDAAGRNTQPGMLSSRRYRHSATSKRIAAATHAGVGSQVLVWGRKACTAASSPQPQQQCVLRAALPAQEAGTTLQMSAVHCAAFTCQVRTSPAFFATACCANHDDLQQKIACLQHQNVPAERSVCDWQPTVLRWYLPTHAGPCCRCRGV